MSKPPTWNVPTAVASAPESGGLVAVEGYDPDSASDDFKSGHICGHCRHVRLREGQEQFRDEKLFQQLFDKLAYGHNKAWYGRTDMFALCAHWDGHMVHLMAPRRIPRHFLDSSCPRASRDESVVCPKWEAKSGGTRGTPHYAGKRRNYEE